MKTAQDFEKAVKEHNITNWPIHNCSICGYECGYLFKDGKVGYDSGCDCVSYSNIQQRPWSDIVEQYNMQTNSDVILKYDLFWHFAHEKEIH